PSLPMPTVLDSLNAALHRALAFDENVFILGEDILDPYGGAFKVTRGLSTDFPGRVLTTPVSEAAIVGIAAGMALRGLRPVVEIMFGDFMTLAADQLINHVAKFRWMYNDQVHVPLVIRTPMGGRRGYGPTHSQTLEKLFLGVPGLRVMAPCALNNPGDLLLHAILDDEDPVLFIENKLLYLLPIQDLNSSRDFTLGQANASSSTVPSLSPLSPSPYAPTYTLSLRDAPPPTLTLVAYGYMADLCRQAALLLAYEDEFFTELVIPTQLSPVDMTPILDSARKTHRLLVVEEGSYTLGWGAEILANAAETLGVNLHAARRLACWDLPIPASVPLESAILPGVEDIRKSAKMCE
ncbi:MAG TPA: transketolase C-terminal domain-containing protein, partial [Anaerolineales bacterium]|nr:transketolase C-terminal domain-containing protein [Anaerolineales bacterium]